jgi:hypothetical protein
MASAIPAASVRGTRTSALEDRGVRGLRCHAEELQVADTVIEAPKHFPIDNPLPPSLRHASGGLLFVSPCAHRGNNFFLLPG